MSHKKLSVQAIVFRSLFLILGVVLVCWFFPRTDTFRYEYEVGKPWRYGRLTAPYDFAIYRSDSIIQQMEDSLRLQLMPCYTTDTSVMTRIDQYFDSHWNTLTHIADVTHIVRLRRRLQDFYGMGVLQGHEKEQLLGEGHTHIQVRHGNHATRLSVDSLPTGRAIYEALNADTLTHSLLMAARLSDLLVANLLADTAATHIEYNRLRQQISITSGVVLAETRIIDQGEIVTPDVFDKLESFRREQQQRLSLTGSDTLMLLGRALLVALVLGSILVFMSLYRPWLYMRQTEVFVALGAVVLMVVLTSVASRLWVTAAYLVPIGIVTIILSTFHGSRTAYFCHIVMALLGSFVAPSHFEYLIIQCIIGMIIVFSLRDGLTDRAQLMHVTIAAAVGYTGSYALYTLATEGSLSGMSMVIVGMMLANALLLLMSYLIIYAMEKLFGFVSGVTLVELCNLGRGLLLRLSQEAPGTFQHSLQVANLTADAAKTIGANAALVRTGAMYHDIGKLWNPAMYTENQLGPNPHDKLSVEESVEMIRRHVSEGIRLAKKERLPREVQDFIQTHHGQGLIRYFYISWCNAHPDEEVSVEQFSYPGPDPTTREQALLMMGDAIEAASRSLKSYTDESIRQLVNNIVDGLVRDGRFNQAKITLHDIQQCKQSFIQGLENIYHARIAYPELHKQQG